MISIAGLDKAKVLAALYNASQCQGMGRLQFVAGDLDLEEAAKLLKNNTYFNYLKGRVMKVELKNDSFDPRLYDRDNGQGAAAAAISKIK